MHKNIESEARMEGRQVGGDKKPKKGWGILICCYKFAVIG